MARYRQGRLNEAVANEIAVALTKVREPRLAGALVSITHAEVTPDLKQAKIYFSTMDDPKEILEGFKRASGVLRHHLAVTLNLRITPELIFRHDTSLEHGAHIASLLKQIESERTVTAQDENGNESGDGEA